jgi:hypothetical protein
VAVTILAGCGGGGGGGGSQGVTAPPVAGPPTPGQGNNTPPEITGTPTVSAVAGQAYTFQPQALDADGDKVTFTIKSKPGWASFDEGTGRLWGTPQKTDVGVHEAIEIAATDGRGTSSLPPFALIVAATQNASLLTIGWDAPTQNEDGTPLTDLTAYRVYYGSASQHYAGTLQIDDPRTVQYVVNNLPTGTYYFAITALNTAGDESVYSTEVNATVN